MAKKYIESDNSEVDEYIKRQNQRIKNDLDALFDAVDSDGSDDMRSDVPVMSSITPPKFWRTWTRLA